MSPLARGRVRAPAVAGLFYPDEARRLGLQVDGFVADGEPWSGQMPKALIVPHAGYVYSGPVAGHAYATLREHAAQIRRVVLLGPAHRVSLRGLALPHAAAFSTPLGEVPLADVPEVERLSQVVRDDRAHALEHSLEVQLPFLQRLIPSFELVLK